MILKPRLVLVHADDRVITAAFLEAEGGKAIDLTEWMGAFAVEHENAGTSEVILRFPGCEIEHVHPPKPDRVEALAAFLHAEQTGCIDPTCVGDERRDEWLSKARRIIEFQRQSGGPS